MRLGEDDLVADPDRAHHQEPQVADDVVGERQIRDVVALDVEPEPLALQAAPVRELDVEVELDPSIGHRSASSSRPPAPAPTRRVSYVGAMPPQYIFTMRDLRKVVPPKREILRGINLAFFPGAKIGVLGANGAGQVARCFASWPAWTRTSSARRGRPTGCGSAISRRSRGSTRRRRCAATSRRAWPRPATLLTRFEEVSARFAEPMSDAEMEKLLAEQARLQDAIEAVGGWELDRTVEMAMDALRVPPGDARTSRRSRAASAARGALPAAPGAARHAAPRRADQPPRRRVRGVAGAVPPGVPGHGGGGHPRPLLPRQRGRLDPGARPRRRHPLAGELLVLARAEAGAPRTGGEGGSRPPADARARARVDPDGAARPAGQEQGPRRGLRDAPAAGGRAPVRRHRDRDPARPAPGRRRGGRRPSDEGLRRPRAHRRSLPVDPPRGDRRA